MNLTGPAAPREKDISSEHPASRRLRFMNRFNIKYLFPTFGMGAGKSLFLRLNVTTVIGNYCLCSNGESEPALGALTSGTPGHRGSRLEAQETGVLLKPYVSSCLTSYLSRVVSFYRRPRLLCQLGRNFLVNTWKVKTRSSR